MKETSEYTPSTGPELYEVDTKFFSLLEDPSEYLEDLKEQNEYITSVYEQYYEREKRL